MKDKCKYCLPDGILGFLYSYIHRYTSMNVINSNMKTEDMVITYISFKIVNNLITTSYITLYKNIFLNKTAGDTPLYATGQMRKVFFATVKTSPSFSVIILFFDNVPYNKN